MSISFNKPAPESHYQCREIAKNRDQLRELCVELLDAVKKSSLVVKDETAFQVCCGMAGQECCGCPDIDWHEWARQLMDDNHLLITKAEKALGGNDGANN